jgi:4-amino-4-deoxy-L-arabinose transferase-like glycosyltransferase
MRAHWPLGLVLVAFAGAAFLIPTLAPVAVNDDFLYTRSVELLVRQHEVRVLPAAAMTLVFQIGWGGVFAWVFGDTLGVLRASTVTFAGLGGIAMYALCRELRVSHGRSALGAALFLFNPISLAVSYTFMTDTYLLTLVTVAVWCYVRGLRSGAPDRAWTIAGSVVTALAFLVRQPGILVAIGVLTHLAVHGQLRWDRRSARTVARVALVPVLTAVTYLAWARLAHGVPDDSAQAGTLRAIGDAGVDGTVTLVGRLAVLLLVYLGLFVLPAGLAALGALPAMVRAIDRRTGAVIAIGAGVLAVLWVGSFAPFTSRRPWSPQYFGQHGAGPIDIRGGRAPAVPSLAVDVLLALALISAATLVVVALARSTRAPGPEGARLGVLLAVGGWLALGLVPQAAPLRDTAYAYDRYFLPLLPLAVAGLLARLRPVRILTPVSWVLTAAMGAFSVAATHDHLALQRATWELAAEARAGGTPLTGLDAGAAWDGYHLYESSHRAKAKVDLKRLRDLGFTGPLVLSARDGSPWWIGYYAPTVDSRTVVAGDRLYGYRVVRRLAYPSWLHADPQYVYLLRARPTGRS